jgi:4-hydroxy-tetrahydrodipicolinate synthase
MFCGLSAFPLTPMNEVCVAEGAFARLVERLAAAKVARMGNISEASRLSDRLEPLWAMFRRKGSLRAMATAAELQGLVSHPSLPLPLRGLEGIEREELQSLPAKLELTE